MNEENVVNVNFGKKPTDEELARAEKALKCQRNDLRIQGPGG